MKKCIVVYLFFSLTIVCFVPTTDKVQEFYLAPLSQAQTNQKSDKIKNKIWVWHHGSNGNLTEEKINQLLGFKEAKIEKTLSKNKLKKQFPEEQSAYGKTDYEKMREILKQLELTSKDTFYDLGSGYGHTVIYTAIASGVKAKGIELVRKRVRSAITVSKKLALKNVEFIQGNVLEQNFSDGTVFYLFNPFSLETLKKVIQKLKEIGFKKKIQIVAWWYPCAWYLEAEAIKENSWLRKKDNNLVFKDGQIYFFESVPSLSNFPIFLEIDSSI